MVYMMDVTKVQLTDGPIYKFALLANAHKYNDGSFDSPLTALIMV